MLADHDRRRVGNEDEIVLTVSDIITHPEFEEYHNDIGGKKKRIMREIKWVRRRIMSAFYAQLFFGFRDPCRPSHPPAFP